MSSRHRAKRDLGTGEWQIETWRLHESSNSGPITVRAYVEALPERTYAEVLETIAGSPGSDMAVFELGREARAEAEPEHRERDRDDRRGETEEHLESIPS